MIKFLTVAPKYPEYIYKTNPRYEVICILLIDNEEVSFIKVFPNKEEAMDYAQELKKHWSTLDCQGFKLQ